MRRREFITLLGGAAATTLPLAARAQQSGKVPRIGLLGPGSEAGMATRVAGFHSGLRELGYVEGGNVIIERRWADDKYERLPELVAELVRIKYLSSSIRFAKSSGDKKLTPVIFPPGRARLATTRKASPIFATTMGIVVVAALAARVPGVPKVTITSTLERRN